MKFDLPILATCAIAAMVPTVGCNKIAATSVDLGKAQASDKALVSKSESHNLVPFPHDKELDTYLTSVCGFMLEPPNDAKFGYTRVQPMGIHATKVDKVKGYAEVEKLTTEYDIRTFVVGTKKPLSIKNEFQDAHHLVPKNPKLDASTVNMKEVLADQYNYFSTSLIQVKKIEPFEPELVDAVLRLKPILDEKNLDVYSEPITVNGMIGNLMAKAVRPPDKTCLSCHANISEGRPIGYAVATIWKKKS